MLPKKERFTRDALEALAADPALLTSYNKLGTLKYRPGGRRLAVVTSSKHEKRAVARNLLRRRIYDRFRSSPAKITGIFYASKHSYALDAGTVRSLFDSLLLHANAQ